MKLEISFILTFVLLIIRLRLVNSEALQLTKENYQDTLDKNKVVFINFYADWCRFSQMLKPIWDATSNIIHDKYTDVKLGRIDCEKQQDIALQNSVSKYPTLKIFRNGKALRKEYRGQRSVDAFSAFIKQHMKPSLTDITKKEDMKIDENKNNVIGYFENKQSPGYDVLKKVADQLRETIDFFAVLGEASAQERAVGEHIVYKPKKKLAEPEATYTGPLDNVETLKSWADDKANPLVREITFENGEELTEEGLPFVLLFHKPDDSASIQRFKNGVMRELMDQRGRVNFLTADGTTFSHPLHHLGKSMDDLPIICIDSFRHMYMFKNFNDIDVPGKLKQFVADLHSGKLHQDFHNPPPDGQVAQGHHHGQPQQPQPGQGQPQPDQGQPQPGQGQPQPDKPDGGQKEQPPPPSGDKKQDSGSGQKEGPPETVFNKLAPSENRYTLLHWRDYSGNYRDEL